MAQTSRRYSALLAAAALLAACTSSPRPGPAEPGSSAPAGSDHRPNIVVILTDDQSMDTLPHSPPAMPYLQRAVGDQKDHWVHFPNAFINSPLCCPSRATLLTGRYALHTGVTNNYSAKNLDESSTLATWLHDAGYTTGLFGKYMNEYPYDRGPYVPPGWDRWVAKAQGLQTSEYYHYTLIEDGSQVHFGGAPQDYLTNVLANEAVDFVKSSSGSTPFLLWFAPTAPHFPWIPAPNYRGSFAGQPIHDPPSVAEANRSDKPAWIRALPPLSPEDVGVLNSDRRREYEMLRSVDDSVRRLVATLRDTGELSDTVIFFLTDNGFSFGEHGYVSKPCPYEECIDTPLYIRDPGVSSGSDPRLVSNVDLAPTVAALAGLHVPEPDGRSLVPLLRERAPAWRKGVLIEWAGGGGVPPFWGVRTADFTYVEYPGGGRELYDLGGRIGEPDPYELRNRAGESAFAKVQARLSALLARLRVG